MRITGGAGERGFYFDRLVNTITQEYSQYGVAPHILTTRLTYYVPWWQMFYVSSVTLRMVRADPPTTADAFTVFLYYTTSDMVSHVLATFTAQTILRKEGIMQYLTNPIVVKGGDSISIATSDVSTGGTTDMNLSIVGFTFER